MHGASISKWTMAYFAAALAFLVLGLATWGCGYGLPTTAVESPETVAVVHLIGIGWLGLLFCGALLQFVPVLAATHLRMAWVAAPSLLLLLSGLGLLTAGFLALGGHVNVDIHILSVAAVPLVAGFGALAVSLSTTIVASRAFDVPGLLVMVGLAALLATVAMGAVFTGVVSGIMGMPGLASALPDLVPLHAASGLLGWMTVIAIGVSYRLFAMFMLAPENGHSKRTVIILAVGALATLYCGVALVLFDMSLKPFAPVLAVALALALVMAYGRDIWRMLRARRRRTLELNSLAGLFALVFLCAGTAMLTIAIWFGMAAALLPTAFYLLGLGWLTGLGLAQLYKIVPFLTWLEAYGPVMGRSQVPRVQDLVDERNARAWFGLFYLAVCCGATALMFDADLLFRAASLCQCAAVLALALEYLRARRLSYAPADLRLPPGTASPHLVYASPTSKE